MDKEGGVVECPLKHTDVQAEIAGFIARAKVTQTFVNPSKEKVEAVYVFPLPHEAAVDDMTMVIGQRRIVGLIKRRAEARQIYEQALYAGQTAALLEQERPNIFTQSVGNIPPGAEVKIEISYVDVLQYDLGSYEFQFPMVVGPRYNPGAPIASPTPRPAELRGKVSPPDADTTQVPDASRINPPVMKPGFRNGHDISLTVSLNAGVPIQNMKVSNHRVEVQRDGKRVAVVRLAEDDSLPNKDFVLRYDVVGKQPEMAVLAHTNRQASDAKRLGDGYFLLMIQPREDERLTKSPPREIVFLVDVSGSMSGQPTAKVIDAMKNMLRLCREIDTFQVVTFASQAHKLFEKPRPVTKANIERATAFSRGLRGSGGTEMLKGVKMAIDEPLDEERRRIVVMLTDGYIGNEAQIIEHVGQHCEDQIRFWAIGIGASPNMFLIDGVARQGGGMGKKLGLQDDTTALTQEVMTRIQTAQLADIRIDWGNLEIVETYPARLPELWAGRPVMVFGRYRQGGRQEITIRGNVEGEAVSWPLEIELPKKRQKDDVLAKVWARKKVESLMHSTAYHGSPAVEEEVTALALDYRLMTQYTSFVAVDESTMGELDEPPRAPRRMLVPVPLPKGTNWEGFFGGLNASGSPGEPARESWSFAIPFGTSDSLSRGAHPLPTPGLQTQFGRHPRAAAPFYSGQAPLKSWAALAPSQAARRSASGERRYGGMGGAVWGLPQPPAAAPGRPATTTRLRLLARPADQLADTVRLEGLEEQALTQQALRAETAALQDAANKAMTQAKEQQEQGNLAAALRFYERAYLLDTAGSHFGHGAGVAADALAGISDVRRQQLADWQKKCPALDAKLDLVVRNATIEAALKDLASSHDLRMEIVRGSLQDVAALMHRAARVDYADLRRATVSQALDWLLLPNQLSWWCRDGEVIVGSTRRRGEERGWVYDVSHIALPTKDELAKVADDKKAAAAQQSADDFLAAVRRELEDATKDSIYWFAPGQLLVFGKADGHAAAARLFERLADPNGNAGRASVELHEKTVRRAQQRRQEIAERRTAQQLAQVAEKHNRYAWPLLAAAANGRLDLEALTHLQIAWSRPETAELLEGNQVASVLRSCWIVQEAARALPEQSELEDLAATARKRAFPVATKTLRTMDRGQEDARNVGRIVYAALVTREDDDCRALALEWMDRAKDADTTVNTARLVTRLLLRQAEDADRTALRALLQQGVSGPDLVALTALAARRSGDDTWSDFREHAQEMLGGQALPGEVVVFVSRLSGTSLPLVMPSL
jgi:Ca-activated chloride channel family protein